MSATLTLTSYGAGELYTHFFQAIASQHHAASAYRSLIHTATLLAGTWALIEGVAHRQVMATARWLAIFLIMFYLLFLPTATLRIVDRTQGNHQHLVSGVPVGLAMMASVTSQIGDALTRLVEPLFSTPTALSYRHSGLLMASQIMQASQSFELQDSVLRKSLSSFVGQCVFYDLALGRYQMEELKHAPNLWLFLKSKASHARAFVLFDKAPPSSHIMPCFEGIEVLDRQWHQALDEAASYYGSQWFPQSVDPKRTFLSFLPLGLGYLSQTSSHGATILQQMLLEHSFDEGVMDLAAKVGADAALNHYAIVKAQQQKRLTNHTIGQMAAYWLPLMKNVFEAMLYGAFLIVFLLCLFPFGPAILKNYIFSLIWLQSWAPLYAIINGVMVFYLSGYGDSSSSLAFISKIREVHSDMVGLAGYLSMSVPFIAMGLVRSLSGTFTQMATTVMGVTQSAAGSAASEAISGNLSMGNVQAGNTSLLNTSMNHFDSSTSLQSGGFKASLAGGASIGLSADESATVDTRPATSSINTGVHFSDAVRVGSQESFERSKAATRSKMKHYGEAISHATRDTFELAKHHAKNESQGDSYSVTDSNQVAHSLAYIQSMNKKLAKELQISESDSADLLTSEFVNANLSIGNSLFSAGAGAKAEHSQTHSKRQQHNVSRASEFFKQHQLSEHIDIALRAAHDQQYHSNTEDGQRLVQSLAKSEDASWHARDEMQAGLSQTQALHHTAQQAKDHAATIDLQANQAFVEYLLKQPSLTTSGQLMSMDEIAELATHHPERLTGHADTFKTSYTRNWIAEHQKERLDPDKQYEQWQQEVASKQPVKQTTSQVMNRDEQRLKDGAKDIEPQKK